MKTDNKQQLRIIHVSVCFELFRVDSTNVESKMQLPIFVFLILPEGCLIENFRIKGN